MDVFGIALSGMQAAQAQINVTAQNVANSNTPGYRQRRADLVELSGGGVGVAGVSQDPSAGAARPDGREGSNVDLPSQMINLTRAKLLYNANAMVAKIASQTTGTLLDIFDRERERDRH